MGGTIGVVEVLTSKTVLRIRYRSSSKYLAIKNILDDTAKGLELKIKLRVKVIWIEDFFSLSISLLIKKKPQDIRTIEIAIEA